MENERPEVYSPDDFDSEGRLKSRMPQKKQEPSGSENIDDCD